MNPNRVIICPCSHCFVATPKDPQRWTRIKVFLTNLCSKSNVQTTRRKDIRPREKCATRLTDATTKKKFRNCDCNCTWILCVGSLQLKCPKLKSNLFASVNASCCLRLSLISLASLKAQLDKKIAENCFRQEWFWLLFWFLQKLYSF